MAIVYKSLHAAGEKDYETKVAKPISGKFQGHLPYSSFHTRRRCLFFQTQLYECLKSLVQHLVDYSFIQYMVA